jgi:hypothetical protein
LTPALAKYKFVLCNQKKKKVWKLENSFGTFTIFISQKHKKLEGGLGQGKRDKKPKNARNRPFFLGGTTPYVQKKRPKGGGINSLIFIFFYHTTSIQQIFKPSSQISLLLIFLIVVLFFFNVKTDKDLEFKQKLLTQNFFVF